MKRGPVELVLDEEKGEIESKVINHIFGRLQHPGEIFGEYLFQTLESFFPIRGCFLQKYSNSL